MGLDERTVFAGYALALAAFIGVFFRFLRSTDVVLLVGACAFLSPCSSTGSGSVTI